MTECEQASESVIVRVNVFQNVTKSHVSEWNEWVIHYKGNEQKPGSCLGRMKGLQATRIPWDRPPPSHSYNVITLWESNVWYYR